MVLRLMAAKFSPVHWIHLPITTFTEVIGRITVRNHAPREGCHQAMIEALKSPKKTVSPPQRKFPS